MIDQEIFRKLKQIDIGKDRDKTKQRVRELWSGLGKVQREAILNLADIKKYTVERSYKQGNISAKLAAAMAQTLGVDPFYLTGAVDEQAEYSDELLIQFLVENNYGKLITGETKSKRKRKNQQEAEQQPALAEADELDMLADIEDDDSEVYADDPMMILDMLADELLDVLSEEDLEKFDTMSEDEVVYLIKALMLRARFSDNAKHIMTLVKFALIQ